LIGSAEVAAGSDAQRRASARGFLVTAFLLVGTTVVATELLLPFLISFLLGDEFLPALTCSRLLLGAAALLGLRRFATDLARGFGRPGVESVAEVASWPILLIGGLLVVGAGALGGGIEAFASVILVASAVSFIVALVYLARVTRRGGSRVTEASGA
jgi:hypothetical protein